MAQRLKRPNCPKWIFFLEKQLKFSCNYQPLSFCKSFLKSWFRVTRISTIFGTKMVHLTWTKVFWNKPLSLLSSTYWLYLLCKISKNSCSGSRTMAMHHFGDQNGPFAPPKFFFKIINIILIYLLAPFILQNLKKILPTDPELEDVQFLGPKWPISSNENFFRKPVHEPCFFYSCPSTCQKWKSDINLLVKYWWLKNTEISLAESHICL